MKTMFKKVAIVGALIAVLAVPASGVLVVSDQPPLPISNKSEYADIPPIQPASANHTV